MIEEGEEYHKLLEYFNELKKELKLPEELSLLWIPDKSNRYSGKIENGVIYVYDESIEEAEATVLHELVELLVVSVKQADKLAKSEKESYFMREAVVESLCSFISKNYKKRREEISNEHYATK